MALKLTGMSESLFNIGAEGVDAKQIVEDIRTRVAKNREAGVYADSRIARAERTNLANLRSDEEFLGFYLECLRDAVEVDINDFEIRERRAVFGGVAVRIKRTLWKLLKFYTYRLWSQQNQTNCLLLFAIEGIETRHRDRIHELEDRIAKLESTLARPS